MQRKIQFILLVASIFLLNSCQTDSPPNPNVIFKAILTGANERPNPNSSTATGTATLTFNKGTKIFTIVVEHTVSTPTNGHIHKGAVDSFGNPVFPFTTFTSPINFTSAALTSEQETDLMAGLYYVNIHSSTYSAGEIRGQLIMQ